MSKRNFVVVAMCFATVVLSTIPVDAQGPIRNRIRQRLQARIGAQAITPYFERDRLLDITEWFDGNNYNPSNEVLDRLTDLNARFRTNNTFDYGTQNDWFGFQSETQADSRWFYDFYDHGYYAVQSPNVNANGQVSYRYYDTDNDGLYDAYTAYTDRNMDGKPDSQQWFAFDDDMKSDNSVASSKSVDHAEKTLTSSKPKSSTVTLQQSVSGTVLRIKQTRTPTAIHSVIALKTDDKDEFFVDIGPATQVNEWKVESGDKISAKGPVVDIGEKQLMLADHVTVNSKTHTVQRQNKAWNGVIIDTRTAKIRGQENMIAIVYTPEKKRVMVDLGPADQVKIDAAKDATITVTGVPMEVDNRQIIMAHEVEQNGKKMVITRVFATSDSDK